jgi:hypothetical protein
MFHAWLDDRGALQNENSRLSFTHVSIKRTKETGHYPRPHSSLHQAIVSAADQAERVRLSEAAQACRKPSKCLLAYLRNDSVRVDVSNANQPHFPQ